MIYNYTKCESVIAKIMADLDSTEVRQRTSDIREWIFEAMEKIGAPMLYISKESGTESAPILKILDYLVPLPADLSLLDAVAYSLNPNGPWIPMGKTTGIFKEPHKKPQKQPIHTAPPHDPANKAIEDHEVFIEEHQPPAEKMITSLSQFYTINGMKYVDNVLHWYRYDKPEYFLKPGWLVTNKDKGFIKLAYKAIATDERGYPLIPDLPSYQEAIYWYVVMKLSFPKFLSGKLGSSTSKYAAKYAYQSYSYIQQQWHFYRNQAYAEAMMPTADDMKNIKRDWNRLIPEYEADYRFFKDINKEEITYNDYYHGY